MFFTQSVKMTTEGKGWTGEPLVFIHGHISLLGVFYGKNPD